MKKAPPETSKRRPVTLKLWQSCQRRYAGVNRIASKNFSGELKPKKKESRGFLPGSLSMGTTPLRIRLTGLDLAQQFLAKSG
jgi:hypothetical protein